MSNKVQIESLKYWPDMVLELDEEVRVFKIKSSDVDEMDSVRFILFLKLFDSYYNKTGKNVNLSILSTVEESKKITCPIGEDVFTYDVINISDEECEEIKSIIDKHSDMVETVRDFKLSGKPASKNLPNFLLENIKTNLNNKIHDNFRLFEHFNVNYNRVFILGSLDYLRIVLREEKLNKYLKNDLYGAIGRYLFDIEKIYSLCNGDEAVFENMNLDNLITHFDTLQIFISQDLDVLPRLDDDAFDDSLFY